ncbi:hypothetical protein Bbelb_192700 [Branchiostoma belcheri]|nr:hypothetical protein Bbelb_192700 [Branchiostoma belcheri]
MPELRVIVQSDLQWNSHISKMVAKANSMTGFIKRKIGFNTNIDVRKALYTTLSHKLMSLVEGVERRATKFILGAQSNNLTYKERRNTLAPDCPLSSAATGPVTSALANIDTEKDFFVRGVKKAIYIRAHKRSLNRDGGRFRLPATFDAPLTSSRFRLPESDQRLHHTSDEGCRDQPKIYAQFRGTSDSGEGRNGLSLALHMRTHCPQPHESESQVDRAFDAQARSPGFDSGSEHRGMSEPTLCPWEKGQVSNGSCPQLADESSARRAGVVKADLERNQVIRQLAAGILTGTSTSPSI